MPSRYHSAGLLEMVALVVVVAGVIEETITEVKCWL
jgi:hypothetical protein